MERPVVAVVDDGVNDGLFPGAPPLLDLEVDAAGKVVPRREAGERALSHGTVCAAVLRAFAPGCDVVSLRAVDSRTGLGRCEALVRAVDWCAAQGLRQINLSNGSVQFFDFDALHACARRAREAGALLVAAQSNAGLFTAPACFDGVLGVRCDGALPPGAVGICRRPADGVELRAHLPLTLKDRYGLPKNIKLCSSYSTAAVSGMLAALGTGGRPAEEALDLLTKASFPGVRWMPVEDRPDLAEGCPVPVVVLRCGGRGFPTGTARALQRLFLEQGSQCALLSAHPADGACCEAFLPGDAQRQAAACYAKYRPDVLLVEEGESPLPSLHADLEAHPLPDGAALYEPGTGERRRVLYGEASAENLFAALYAFFEPVGGSAPKEEER